MTFDNTSISVYLNTLAEANLMSTRFCLFTHLRYLSICFSDTDCIFMSVFMYHHYNEKFESYSFISIVKYLFIKIELKLGT